MKIDMNEVYKLSAMQARKQIESGKIDRFYVSLFDFVNKKPIDFTQYYSNAKLYERKMIEYITEGLYALICSNMMSIAFAANTEGIEKPQNIKTYARNIKGLLGSFSKFNKDMEIAVREKIDSNYIIFNTEENRQVFKDFYTYVQALLPYFETAAKIEAVCTDKKTTEGQFYSVVAKMNAKAGEALVDAVSKSSVAGSEVGIDGFVSMNNTLLNFFDKHSNVVAYMGALYAEGEKAQEEARIENEKSNKKQVEITPAEQERQDAIKRVNSKYEEFVNDTMRDLQMQVPYSAREKYEKMLKKFETFVNNFTMPLAQNANIKYIQKVEGQLDEIINDVSRISESSKVSIVYGNPVMQ